MKKISKILSIIMIVALAFTTVGFSNLTRVDAKSSVKSVKVKGAKKKMTLKVGDVKTFKVKVKAKKGKKKFSVKTSNATVVNVKKKGKKITLAALKAGIAKVTVKAKKKKYVIKVTVVGKEKTTTKKIVPTKAPIVTTAAEPTVEPQTNPGPTTVAPEPETKAPEEPTTKPVEPTTKPVEPTTKPVETTTKSVDPTTKLEETTTVAPIESTTEETTTVDPDENTRNPETYDVTAIFDAGKICESQIWVYYSGENVTLESIKGVPNGITYKLKSDEDGDQYLSFEGTIETCGTYNVVAKIKDQDGVIDTYNIEFRVVDDKHIVASDYSEEIILDEDESSASGEIHPDIDGGCETFALKIVENTGNVFKVKTEMIENEDESLTPLSYITYSVKKPGIYTAKVKVTDYVDESVTTTFNVKIEVKKFYWASGVVTNQNGEPIVGAKVVFNDGIDDYDDSTDVDGEYSMNILNGTYNVVVSYFNSKTESVVTVTDDTETDFVLDEIYKVTISSSNPNVDAEQLGYWKEYINDEEFVYVGYSDAAILSVGQHTIVSDGYFADENSLFKYKATVTKNVTGDTTALADVTLEKVEPEEQELRVGSNYLSDIASDFKFYKFVPKNSGYYTFETNFTGDEDDEQMILYDSDFDEIEEAYCEDDDSDNISLTEELEKGETYYIAVRNYNNHTMNGYVNISYSDE